MSIGPTPHAALLSYAGLKVPTAPSPYFSTLNPAASQLSALEFHRSAQLCDYRQLLNLRQYQALHASGLGPYAAYLDPYTQYLYKTGDPRARFVQEEPKPSHSYIGLIAMAILGSKEKKLVLSDIYQWILDNYPYFRTRGPGWRNSIRHNLSLNDCFIKSGRSANGKGHYWAVHPANVDDFMKGDFRRRRAQRKVRQLLLYREIINLDIYSIIWKQVVTFKLFYRFWWFLTPPRNHGGVIFSLQFVCVSVCVSVRLCLWTNERMNRFGCGFR